MIVAWEVGKRALKMDYYYRAIVNLLKNSLFTNNNFKDDYQITWVFHVLKNMYDKSSMYPDNVQNSAMSSLFYIRIL